MTSLRAWIEQAYWSWMLRTSRRLDAGGLAFVHVSAAHNRPAAEIQVAIADAMDRLRRAGEGFPELVRDHLRFVAALDAPSAHALVHARGYVSPFDGPETLNSHFLACRLVWAATYIRLSRDALHLNKERDHDEIRRAAHEAQLRFTRQFPDAQSWVAYLERHPFGA